MKSKKSRQRPIMKINKKLNPFEIHINRSKHQVLGRKLKSDKGMPGISRHKAFKKRKDTLLQEYKMRHKSNHFIDQRIGERNSEMTEDDRIMARFTAERMRMFNKKTMFNLSESEVLTHRGQTLSEIERFEDTRSDDEEDEMGGRKGSLKSKFVGEAHFGGGMLTKNKQDRESLIDELINESKKRKAERQRNKEDTLEATEKLDEEWKILGQITTSTSVEYPVKEPVNKKKDDDYDVVMRQLKFEPHGQASQRLKTDEDIAKEDKEQLEKLEQERLKQLREIEANKFGKHRSSDDIDDGFSNLTNDFIADDEGDIEENSQFSSESDVEVDNADDSEHSISYSGEENESDSNHPKLDNKDEELIEKKPKPSKRDTNSEDCKKSRNGEESDFLTNLSGANDTSSDGESSDECAMEDLTDLMPSLNDAKNVTQQKKEHVKIKETFKTNSEKKVSEEGNCSTTLVDIDLPYVLDVPANYESFKELFNKHSIEQQNLIFDRLLKSNHPTLEPVNKKKMLKLADYIIKYVSEGDIALDALPNMILHFSIFKEFNKEGCLNMMVDTFSVKLDDFDVVTPSEQSIKFLVWYVMLFLNPQGMDVLLPINKPALSQLSKLVSQADILSKPQVTVSMLCCYLLLQDAKSSSTVYTDAVIFLQDCFKWSISNYSSTCSAKSKKIKQHDSQDKSKTSMNKNKNKHGDLKLPLTDLGEKDVNIEDQVLYLSVILLAGFVKAYRKYPQSKILFKKVYNVVSHVKIDFYQGLIKEAINELKTLLEILQTASLSPLVKAAKKPKALRQYDPSFHIVTEGRRNSLRGLPVEKQEEQKLLHKYKTEMKGAMRELRRDRVFLANVKLGEKARSDAERVKKVKEIFGSAAAQQGELRSLKRKK